MSRLLVIALDRPGNPEQDRALERSILNLPGVKMAFISGSMRAVIVLYTVRELDGIQLEQLVPQIAERLSEANIQ